MAQQPGSITHWLTDLSARQGTDRSELLWKRFGWRLVRFARKQMCGLRDRAYDEEDLALSTMKDFYLRATQGAYAKLESREDLWQLLATIALHKTMNRRRLANRLKRRTNKEVVKDAYPIRKAGEIDRKQSPEWITIVAEQAEYLLRLLNEHDASGVLQQIALMKLDGSSNSQIAIELGCTRRSVAARLLWIQRIWDYYLEQQGE